MKKYCKLLIIWLLGCNIGYSVVPGLFPRGCEVRGFSFQKNYLMLNDDPIQSFYLIQNSNIFPIELIKAETSSDFISPSLLIKLESKKWAAFAIDMANMYFQCFIIKDDNKEAISCRDVLDICQYPRAKFALSNMGSYWVAVNKNQKDIIKEAIAKGIYLHW